MYAVQHGAGEGRSYLMEHNAILDSKLSLSSNIPLYAQLVGIIKREISSGALKIGDLLPSEAELCRALDISRNTARQAIGELEDEGLVDADSVVELLENKIALIVPKDSTLGITGFEDITKAEKIVAWNSPVMQFTMYVVVLLLVAIGGTGIIHGTMGTGELTSIIVYALQIIGSLMMVTFVFVMIMIAEASTDRITEVLEEVPEMQDKADAVTEVKDGEIIFDHVNFSYAGEGGNLSLKDVDLHIRSGQTIEIIGGTGSAKSTLVQLIPRLYDVTEGCVKVGGIDVRDYNLEALRDQVSMVLQKNVLFTGTIYDNIRWGDENASDEEVQRMCKLAQADGFVNEFPAGYNTQIVQGGNNVSGGQKQRTAIARALVTRPAIILADEPTGNLDSQTELEVMSLLKSCVSDFGQTLIMITHDETIAQMADEMIIIEDGKAVRR